MSEKTKDSKKSFNNCYVNVIYAHCFIAQTISRNSAVN